MKTATALVACVLALLLALGRAAADPPPPTVTEMQVDAPDHLTVGDQVQVHITVDAPSGTTVSLTPQLPRTLDIVGTPSVTANDAGNGRSRVEVTATLAVFDTGDVDIPPLTLHYADPSGASGDIQTQAAKVSVASVLPQGGSVTPRGLKPQVDVGSAPTPAWVLATAIAVAVTLVLAVGVFIWRRRSLRRPRPLPPAPEPIPEGPEDRARKALDAAGARLARGEFTEAYASIAGTVRGYLTDRFGFPAFALTTRELQEQMIRRGIERWQARVVAGLLTQCDAVVYASYRPAAERADADLTDAYEIVEMTRPESQEEAVS